MSKIKFSEFSNFQRLNYVQIAPSGSLVALAGKNKQGKSSILDGLEAAICGHNGRVITRPINDSADKAGITVETDDGLTISRTYTAAGSKLTIKAADGAKYGQAKLDSLIGSLGIDSSQFASLNDKDQLKTLLGLVSLPFDPAQLDAERKAIFDRRTDVNRALKELDGQIAGHFAFGSDTPSEEVSVSALVSEYRAAQDAHRKLEDAQDTYNHAIGVVAHLREQLELAEGTLSTAAATLKSVESQPLPDLDGIQESMDNAEFLNEQVRKRQAQDAVLARRDAGTKVASDLTAQIDAIDQRKADGLAAAKFPVEGLGFDADGVLYNGLPFSRASSAEKVLVSAAMMIALNPELRVLIVRNGNDLDSESLAALEEMAADADFQVFIEIVNETGDFGITIEDGEVVA